MSGAWLNFTQPSPPYPSGLTDKEKRAWFRKWITNTTEGRAYWLGDHECSFKINSDGSFRIEDVVPGTYQLHIFINEREIINHQRKQIGETSMVVRVPEVPEGKADQPLNLGTLNLKLTRPQTLPSVNNSQKENISKNLSDKPSTDLNDIKTLITQIGSQTLVRGAELTSNHYATKEKNTGEKGIPPDFWAEPIRNLNPIKVYTHRVNLVVVLKKNRYRGRRSIYLYSHFFLHTF